MTVSDLQSDIVIGADSISGTLKHVNEPAGNYLAIHAAADVPAAIVTVGVDEPIEVDENGIAVVKISDKDSQTLTVVASKEGYETAVNSYSLSGLICMTE